MNHRSSATAAVFSILVTAFIMRASPAHAELMHFTVDLNASEISASVAEPLSSLRGSATGRFRIVSGVIASDSASPARTTTVKIVCDAASYSSGISMRDRAVTHSVLQAETYPTITFEGGDVDNIVHSSDTSGTGTIRGTLTLHGAAHSIIVPVSVQLAGNGQLQADGEVTFSYTDWGMVAPSMIFGALRAGDQATVRFHIVAARTSG
ncbi:MAG TPA: YceI family protein [Candidatus Binataceae bacterium]|nr:YceI family protein [Candidatus Binataceae bacterium]